MVRLAAALIALALSAAGCAQPPAAVTEAELRTHIAALADDRMQGREPGTPGGAMAEAYVARAFTAAGLANGPAGRRQSVTLTRYAPRAASAGPVAGDALVAIGPRASLRLRNAPVRLATEGDLAGAIVLAPTDRALRSWSRLRAAAEGYAQKGAAAVLFIVPDTGFAAVRADYAEGETLLDGVDRPLALGAITATAAQALRTAGTATLAVRTAVTRIRTANIVGVVRGTRPADGAVVLTAHWDHLGLCGPAGAADRICNGANDNASGVAMLIEVARRVAAGPGPARDVWFVATTAEETGLHGARAFAARPPVPLARIVAALNLDTAVIVPAGAPVAIIGRGRTPALDAAVDAVAREAGRRVDTDTEANVMVERQDGWALGQRGVPAVMVSGSFSDMGGLMAYLRGSYHGPQDDLAHLGPLSGAAEDATLHVALARALADPARYPAPATR